MDNKKKPVVVDGDDLRNSIVFLRGEIIQKMVDLESFLDLVISEYFSPFHNNNNKHRDFHYLVLHDSRMTLAFKQNIFEFILTKYDEKFDIVKYHCKDVLTDKKEKFHGLFERVVAYRNAFAHRRYDWKQDESQESRIAPYLWQLKGSASKMEYNTFAIKPSDIEKYMNEIRAVSDVVFEVHGRMTGILEVIMRPNIKKEPDNNQRSTEDSGS